MNAKFLIQRPEYPDWFAGFSEHGQPVWSSDPLKAALVPLDCLVDRLEALKNEKPVASLVESK